MTGHAAVIVSHRSAGLRLRALQCGVLSSLLYGLMLVVVPWGWDAYDSAAQTVSELSAIGAPTRPIWIGLAAVWSLLYAVFGWGVWRVAGSRTSLRAVGLLILGAATFGLFWPPMHLRGASPSLTDSLHIAWTVMNGVLTLLALGFGAAAFGKAFRNYTIATAVVMLGAGALTSMGASRIPTNLPTPWLGVWERVNIGVWLLWVAALSVILLRSLARGRAEGRTP